MRYLLMWLGIYVVFVGLTGRDKSDSMIMLQTGVIVLALGLANIDIVAAIRKHIPPRGAAANKEE